MHENLDLYDKLNRYRIYIWLLLSLIRDKLYEVPLTSRSAPCDLLFGPSQLFPRLYHFHQSKR